MVDIEKLVKDAENAFLTIGGVQLSNGTHLTNVRIDTLEDERQFRDLMAVATSSRPAQTVRATPSLERKEPHCDDFSRTRRKCISRTLSVVGATRRR